MYAEIPPGSAAFTAGGVVVVADSTWAAIQGREALQRRVGPRPRTRRRARDAPRSKFEELPRSRPRRSQRRRCRSPRGGSGQEGRGGLRVALPGPRLDGAHELRPSTSGPTAPRRGCPPRARSGAQQMIAEAAGLAERSVTVHTTLMGGGFGRRYTADFVIEAAQVARRSARRCRCCGLAKTTCSTTSTGPRPPSVFRRSGHQRQSRRMETFPDFHSIDAMWSPKGKETPENSDARVNSVPDTRLPRRTPRRSVWGQLARGRCSVEHSTSGFVVETLSTNSRATVQTRSLSVSA